MTIGERFGYGLKVKNCINVNLYAPLVMKRGKNSNAKLAGYVMGPQLIARDRLPSLTTGTQKPVISHNVQPHKGKIMNEILQGITSPIEQLKNRPTWELEGIVIALRLHHWLNTDEENERLNAAKKLLKERKKGGRNVYR